MELHVKLSLATAVAISVLATSGCSFARSRVNNTELPTLAQLVEPGKTSSKDLTALLGDPNSVVPLGDGKQVFLYTFGDAKTKGFNLLLFGWEKTNTGFDSGYFIIEDGTVKEKLVSSNSQDLPWEWWPFTK